MTKYFQISAADELWKYEPIKEIKPLHQICFQYLINPSPIF